LAITDELAARLGALEEELQAVKARLEAESDRRRGLMRDSRRCPACGGQKIFHVKKIEDGATQTLSAAFKNAWRATRLGRIELFICAGCGHAELQVDDPAQIEGKENVELLPPPPGGRGPYR
jgi:hypothetical protein